MDLNMTFIDIVKALALETYKNVWLSSQVYSDGKAVHIRMLA